jgi:hypothetical protein
MKKTFLILACAAVAPFAFAQTSTTTEKTRTDTPLGSSTETKTTTTTGGGTITEFTPGSVIVLKESSGPRRYRFGKSVTYVTKSGKVLDEATVKSRIRVGVPVHVDYTGTGDSMVVSRVVLDED